MTAISTPESRTFSSANSFQASKRVLVVVTGASRGIGRELVLQLAKHLGDQQPTATPTTHFFVLARSGEALAQLKELVESSSQSANAKVEILAADLAQQPFSIDIGQRIRALEDASTPFDLCLVVHNAGTLGDLSKKSSELNDEQQWHEYLQTNLLSAIMLNNQIVSALGKEDKRRRIFVVNITSLLSVKAYPSFTQYSVGKAAREAYFRAFAAEHPECRVINYSPGPVDTGMHQEVGQRTYDPGVRDVFTTRRHDSNLHRKLLSPEETVQRLIRMLEENKFESGARVDYFDKC